MGLRKPFKGIFKGLKVSEAIKKLENDNQDFGTIIDFLKYKEKDKDFILSQALLESGKLKDPNYKDYYKGHLLLDSTDRKNLGATSRIEQAALRANLFKNARIEKCSICHKNLPVDVLVAGHIKPRTECSHEERIDSHIVMPVCKIGCDDLFERGYVIVEEGGGIVINTSRDIPRELYSFMIQYEGKYCTHYNSCLLYTSPSPRD